MEDFNPIKACFDMWVAQGNSPFKFKEFREEFAKFIFVSRILKNYKNKGILNTRLLLNHMVILFNIFGVKITPIFFIIADEEVWSELHAVLKYMNYIPEDKKLEIDDVVINLRKYPPSKKVTEILNAL